MKGNPKPDRISARHRRPAPEAGEWHFYQHAHDVHELTVRVPKVGDEQWILLLSDAHWDSRFCDRDLLKAHLDEAVEKNAPILVNGDFFDACQGRYDPRRAADEMRPELAPDPGGSYLEEMVKQAAEWLAPYRDHLCLFGVGNHEEAIRTNNEFDLLQSLVDRLRFQPKRTGKYENVHRGGYEGFVAITAYRNDTSQSSVKLYYHHGSGGGGPVTRGVIRTARQAATIDSDILWGGHIHENWVLWTARKCLGKSLDRQEKWHLHLSTPGYQQDNAWAIRKGLNPKVRGGLWLRLYRKDCRALAFDTREAM